MEFYHPNECSCASDHGPCPFSANITREARQNYYFRTALWTGSHLQMTLMCIPVCEDIGPEVHPDTDQLIRIEAGQAAVCMGTSRDKLDIRLHLCVGDAVFVPAGTWHNISNSGNRPLKLSSIYAPSNHSHGTVHYTKADAEAAEY